MRYIFVAARMRKKGVFIFLFIVTTLVACRKQADETADTTYDYFPTDIGRTWVYDVDSILYDDNSGSTVIDSSHHYQYKETITANITDNLGHPAQLVERSFRQSDTDEWVGANSWVISRDQFSAQRVQENVRYAKLVFPLSKAQKWDGNMYNNKGWEQYELSHFDMPATINGKTFEKTLQVVQVLDTNAIEEIKRFEVYARNVGLIYYQSDSINTQHPVGGNPKSRGFRYRLKIKSYQ